MGFFFPQLNLVFYRGEQCANVYAFNVVRLPVYLLIQLLVGFFVRVLCGGWWTN